MKITRLFPIMTGLVLLALTMDTANAQTVIIPNEILTTTTLVVNQKRTTTKCTQKFCRATRPMFAAVGVRCATDIGKTCTLHISLDAKDEISSLDDGFYQFLVDGAAPVPGPTLTGGFYRFVRFQQTSSIGPTRQSYPGSVVATVTNVNDQNHTIAVNIACKDEDGDGCTASAYHSTMRIDVFQP